MDYWDISSKICMMAICLNPVGITCIPSQAILCAKSEVQVHSNKESTWYLGYQLEMVFVRAYL